MILFIFGACFDLAAKCFEKAMRQTGTSLKAAAIDMGIDAAQLRRQLDGHEHLSTRRVFDGMPKEFLQYYAFNLVVDLGIPLDIQTAAQVSSRMEHAS